MPQLTKMREGVFLQQLNFVSVQFQPLKRDQAVKNAPINNSQVIVAQKPVNVSNNRKMY